MNSLQPNIPTRVQAVKGFYANVQGQFGIVFPGDVVDLDRHLASMMIASGKAKQVEGATPLLKQKGYPERKVELDPTADRLDRLQSTVETLSQTVASLVTAIAAGKKKD